MERLSEEQQETLLQLQEICAFEDDQEGIGLLVRCNWNLEMAIQERLNIMEGRPSTLLPNESVGGDSSSDEAVGPPGPSGAHNVDTYQPLPQAIRRRYPYMGPVTNIHSQSWLQWSWTLLMLPFRFVFSTIWDVWKFVRRIFFPAFRAVTDPTGDVISFISAFESKYGSNHPTFYRGSYSMALSDAKRELRFLLVYLHGPDHQDTDVFCRQTLGNRDFIQFVNTNMLFWGCSVASSEGFRVSNAMRESTYPFMALICLRDNKMMIVLRKEGFCTPSEAIGFLGVAIQDNETFLNLARQERMQFELNNRLREEQEVAYRESLEADRERERIREEAEEKRRNEERLQEEERLKTETWKQRLDALKAEIVTSLPDEPAANDVDSIRVSLRFPSGSRAERRFRKNDTLKFLHDVAFSSDACPYDFSIACSYPRKTLIKHSYLAHDDTSYADELNGTTLDQVGLEKAVMLLVVDNQA